MNNEKRSSLLITCVLPLLLSLSIACALSSCRSGDFGDFNSSCADEDGDTYLSDTCGGDDCDDSDPDIHPGATEGPAGDPTCSDSIDNDCDGVIDDLDTGCQECSGAGDCDDLNPCTDDACVSGFCRNTNNSDPCDDQDACTMNDTCSNGVCSGELLDEDGDTYVSDACGGDDCDDSDPDIHPGATEGPTGDPTCDDGSDNDCDGDIDDLDTGCQECSGAEDCDDLNPCTDDACVSGACQNTDNSDPCDDEDACTMNDTCSDGICSGDPLDEDGDTYVSDACGGDDCDDSDPDIHPGATEGPAGDPTCEDGADNDCDGDTDAEDSACPKCDGPTVGGFCTSSVVPVADYAEVTCVDSLGDADCPAAGEVYFGQDGNYSINPESYTHETLGGDRLIEAVTGLTWAQPAYPAESLALAMDQCSTLAAGNYGGLDDWRVPAIRELSRILSRNVSKPGAWPAVLGYFANSFWWSSTPTKSSLDQTIGLAGNWPWTYIEPTNGVGGIFSGARYTFCVSGPSMAGEWVVNPDGVTVTHTTTGLMWHRSPSNDTFDWDAGLQYCETSTVGGFDDWRLPTLREYMSVLDFGQGQVYMSPAFEGIGNATMLTSTPNRIGATTPEAAYVNESSGTLRQQNVGTLRGPARCVRGPD